MSEQVQYDDGSWSREYVPAPDTQPAPASGEGEALREDPARAYYERHGWSGCAGSAWDNLTTATQDGWRAAAREWEKVRRVEEAIGTHAFGCYRPEWKTEHHNGAHDVIRVDHLRAALGGEQAGDGGREGK